MKKIILILSLSFPSLAMANVFNACTGCIDYTGSGGTGSGVVSPGTFTWQNTQGISVSTLSVTNAATIASATVSGQLTAGTLNLNGSTDGSYTQIIGYERDICQLPVWGMSFASQLSLGDATGTCGTQSDIFIGDGQPGISTLIGSLYGLTMGPTPEITWCHTGVDGAGCTAGGSTDLELTVPTRGTLGIKNNGGIGGGFAFYSTGAGTPYILQRASTTVTSSTYTLPSSMPPSGGKFPLVGQISGDHTEESWVSTLTLTSIQITSNTILGPTTFYQDGTIAMAGSGNATITEPNGLSGQVVISTKPADITATHLAIWSSSMTLIDGGVPGTGGGGSGSGTVNVTPQYQVAFMALTSSNVVTSSPNFTNNGTTITISGMYTEVYTNTSTDTWSGNYFNYTGSTMTISQIQVTSNTILSGTTFYQDGTIATPLTASRCVQTDAAGHLGVATGLCGTGGGGGGGTINAAAQFSAPYYSLAGTTTSLSAYPGVTLSTNTGVLIGLSNMVVQITSNTIFSGTTFYQSGAVAMGVSGTSVTISGGLISSPATASTYAFFDANKQLVSTATVTTTNLAGVLAAAQHPALTGDITTTAGSLATTAKAIQANVKTFTSSITINAPLLLDGVVTSTGPVQFTTNTVLGAGSTFYQNGAASLGVSGTSVTFNGGLISNPATASTYAFFDASKQLVSTATITTTNLAGVLAAAQEPAHTGDVTNTAGSLSLAIVGIIQNAHTFTSSSTFNGEIVVSSNVRIGTSEGTNGQVFTTGGPGTVPSWTTLTGAALSSTQTFTGGNTFSATVTSSSNVYVSTGGVLSFNEYVGPTYTAISTVTWSNGNNQSVTLTANTAFNFAAPSCVSTNSVVGLSLLIQTGAGSFATTWPANVKWKAGTAPTTTTAASKVDFAIFKYWCSNSTYYGDGTSQNF